jgi:hypothetical protein
MWIQARWTYSSQNSIPPTQWQKNYVHEKGCLFLQFHFPLETENVVCPSNELSSCIPLLPARIRLHFLTLSHGSEWPRSLNLPITPPPIPHATHFNPRDGSSIFLQNASIHLQDYTMSKSRRQQSEKLYYFMKSSILWDITQCSLVQWYSTWGTCTPRGMPRHFRGYIKSHQQVRTILINNW